MMNLARTGKNRYLLIIISLFLFVSCGKMNDSINLELLRIAIADQRLGIDGSISTLPLTRKITALFLDIPCRWSAHSWQFPERTIEPDKSRSIPIERYNIFSNLRHTGTHNAYMNLAEGKTDIILVERMPGQDELDFAARNNVLLKAKPFARDALVILVNAKNPVQGLTLETVRALFAGSIKTWQEAGVTFEPGSKALEPVHLYSRSRNFGSRELMETLVMKNTVMKEAPEMIAGTMHGLFHQIGGEIATGEDGDAAGIGYGDYFYSVFIFPHDQVRMIGINGVNPDRENIASGQYPLTIELFAVTRKGMTPETPAMLFQDWLVSKDGQKVVEEVGLFPLR
jgi:phosphate transport system substrate-binding protein